MERWSSPRACSNSRKRSASPSVVPGGYAIVQPVGARRAPESKVPLCTDTARESVRFAAAGPGGHDLALVRPEMRLNDHGTCSEQDGSSAPEQQTASGHPGFTSVRHGASGGGRTHTATL